VGPGIAEQPHSHEDRHQRGDRQAHPLLEANKATNLALAAPAFDGALRQSCMVPVVAGLEVATMSTAREVQ